MAYNLKSEEEVKEYLQNLGIEYRFGCYSEKKPEVCHLLADYLEAVKRDFDKAAKVYKLNCDDYGFAKSCYKIGTYTILAKGGVKKDVPAAFKYFQKGCSLGDRDACFNEALMTINDLDEKVPIDVARGMDLLEKSCFAGNEKACYHLSGMYITGGRDPKSKDKQTVVVPKDMKKAFAFAQRGCEMRHVYSCANLSRMYKLGEGVEKDEKLSKHYKDMTLEIQAEIQETNKTLKFQEGL